MNVIWCLPKSFGNVDWLLPLIKEVKATHPNASVRALIDAKNIDEYFVGSDALKTIFLESVDEFHFLQDFKLRRWARLRNKIFRVLNHILPNVVLRQLYYFLGTYKIKKSYLSGSHFFFGHTAKYDSAFTRMFHPLVRFNQGETYLYPPTTDLYLYLKNTTLEKWDHKDDYILCNSQEMAEHFIHKNSSKMVITIPRYDESWMNHLINAHNQLPQSKKVKDFILGKKTYLYLIRGPGTDQMSQSRFEELLTSAMEVFTEQKDTVVIIKPHPRQDLAQLRNTLAAFEGRYIISNLHTFFLSSISDVVISQAVSAAFDALYCNRPVIEYFIFDSDTVYTPDWARLGFVHNSSSQQELRSLVQKADKRELSCGLQAFIQYSGVRPEGEIKRAMQLLGL